MMQAAAILSSHRSQVLYDFHSRFHRDPDEFPRWKRSRLVIELMRDPTTHVGAALLGWKYAPTPESMVMYDRLDFDLLIRMAPEKRSAFKPIRRSWAADVEAQAREITPALRERLRKHVEAQNLGG